MSDVFNCVVCGRSLIGEKGNHHCPETVLKRRDATDRMKEQDYEHRRKTEAQRLNYGLYLLSLNGDF